MGAPAITLPDGFADAESFQAILARVDGRSDELVRLCRQLMPGEPNPALVSALAVAAFKLCIDVRMEEGAADLFRILMTEAGARARAKAQGRA